MERAKKYLLIVIGNFMVALGLGQVVLANGFIAGGVTGIGLIVQHFIPIDVAILTGIINTMLFLVGALLLGKMFAVSTALSAAVFPFFLKFCTTFTLFPEMMQDHLLASLIGAALIGGGIGLIIRNEGSTGGVDVIALVLNKYLQVSVSKLLATIDISIIGLQLFWQQNNGVLYGLLIVLLTSFVLNQTLIYGDIKVQVMVISKKYEQICKTVLYQCDTGVTKFLIETGYAEEKRKALMTVVPYKNLAAVKSAIRAEDPAAFVIVSTVREVNGRGYSMAR